MNAQTKEKKALQWVKLEIEAKGEAARYRVEGDLIKAGIWEREAQECSKAIVFFLKN